MNTITVENARIRVTVTADIAAQYRQGWTGQHETQAQALRGRLLSAAMTKLASATELELTEAKPIDLDEVRQVAHTILMRNYLEAHGRYSVDEALMRHHGGHRMSPGMRSEVSEAQAYADGVLRPVSDNDARRYIEAQVASRDLSAREMQTLKTTVDLWCNRVGVSATNALEKARAFLEFWAGVSRRYHEKRGCLDGWHIEVIGELPNQVGLSRLRPPTTPFNDELRF